MKASELRGKDTSELRKLLIDSKASLLENKRALAAGELPNPRVVTNARRDIARIHTLLTEKLMKTTKEETSNG